LLSVVKGRKLQELALQTTHWVPTYIPSRFLMIQSRYKSIISGSLVLQMVVEMLALP